MATAVSREPVEVTISLPPTGGTGGVLGRHDLTIVLPWYWRGLTTEQVVRVIAAAYRRNESTSVEQILHGRYNPCCEVGDTRAAQIAEAIRGLHAYAMVPRGPHREPNPMAAVRQFLHPGHPTLSVAGSVIREGDDDPALRPDRPKQARS